MDKTKYLPWVNFYTEFADKLRPFSGNRTHLVEKVKRVFVTAGMPLPKLEEDNKPILDVDPFTVFGLFNRGNSQVNRISIVKAFAQEFSVISPVPETFSGIPLLNNLNSLFYCFGEKRKSDDIDNLWKFFLSSLDYADNPTEENRAIFARFYDLVQKQSNIRWNITMGLFWIRPYTYLNLDSTNRDIILNQKIMPHEFIKKAGKLNVVPSAAKYLELIKDCKNVLEMGSYEYKNFPELSSFAWNLPKEELGGATVGEAIGDNDVVQVHYWLYSPGYGAEMWDEFYNSGIMGIAREYIGDLRQYKTRAEMQKAMQEDAAQNPDPSVRATTYRVASLETWQFLHEVKPGDIIFAKIGTNKILGRGVVQSDYIYDPNRSDKYHNIRKVHWTHKGEWENPDKTTVKVLTDVTPYTAYVEQVKSLFKDESGEEIAGDSTPDTLYTKDDFLEEVYMSQTDYDVLTNLLRNKKNVILQGAPGVGKTFAAKRLAYSLMGIKDPNRVMMVQFHQNYSYEDFIMGFRPSASGFELKKGPFYNFCKKAGEDKENDYFFIIDEINRGNLSKIFGELFMLIENDKRGVPLQLLYSDEKFDVPENVYIIGMMNTADRSLAILDYALRRRFAFFELSPAFSTEGFTKYRVEKENPKFDRLIDSIENLNRVIENDDSLGRGFRIGHSYFCTKSVVDDMWLNSVITYEILPLLSEYWFDEPSKVKNWEHTLRSSIQ